MHHNWNWMRDLVTLQDRMNRLFDDAAKRREGAHEAQSEGGEQPEAEMERADWHPLADVFEHEGGYTILLDLPAIDRESLDVSLDDERLRISGERRPAEEGDSRRSERPFGRFARSFSLPSTVNREAITADYKDGVLRLRLPRREEPKARRIEIKVS